MQEASPKQDNQEIKDLQEIIESQAQEINCLKETIYLLKHRQFGRRSEKYTEEQLQLFDDLEVPPKLNQRILALTKLMFQHTEERKIERCLKTFQKKQYIMT
jgi:hypothetical protein